MFSDRSIIENTVIVNNEKTKVSLIRDKKEKMETDRIVKNLNVSLADTNQEIKSLSGGNQQKVVLGRWLLGNSDVYIFDEPTKGVDVGAKEEIYKDIVELAQKSKIIILISSDMPELLSLSDRIGIMKNGRMTRIIQHGIQEEELIKYYLEA